MGSQIKTRRQHFVKFLSPGSFVDEETTKPIEAWDAAMACSMAKAIEERHGAKPYAFTFHTSLVSEPVADESGNELFVQPKKVEESGKFYINGVLRTLDDVVANTDEKESILASNMRCNDWPVVCETRNSYRHTGIFDEKDVVVDGEGNITERGDSPKWKQYRKDTIERVKRERGY